MYRPGAGMSSLLLLHLGFIAFQIYMLLMLDDGAMPYQQLSVGILRRNVVFRKQGPKH